MNTNAYFSQKILKWYHLHARTLPWRGLSDPYAIWISEIMAQQTRLETVIPYYQRWMQRFPDVNMLASATEQDVLAAWEGLGYYSRARNLLKAARKIQAEYGGALPQTRRELETLPGIGRYTAAAISSIAFTQPEPVLDGNVKRVLARVFDLQVPVNNFEGEERCWSLAEQLMPREEPGDYNQAMMELGATLCSKHTPRCNECPVNDLCRSNALGNQDQRPVMQPKPQIPTYAVVAAVFFKNDLVMIARRPSKGLLGGLWEYPGGKVEAGETLPQALEREIHEELGVSIQVGTALGEYHHAYTHFKVHLTAFSAELNGSEPQALEASEIRWVPISELRQYPMGKIDRSISNNLEGHHGFSG
jgi:A/G-specific adenine glycosylase